MAEHQIVKAEKIVLTGAAALEDSLVVPAIMRREGIDNFVGAKDDTINVVVDGVLPYRTYGWRNDRSTELVFDEYVDRKVPVTFGDDIYSGVMLTAEQNKMDFNGWAKLAGKQTEAIGRGLEQKAVTALEQYPYEVEVQLDEANLRRSLAELSVIFDRLNVPGPRWIVADTDLQIALLDDDKLSLAQNIGEVDAQSALKKATLAERYGFTFLKAKEMQVGVSCAMVQDAMIFTTAAPETPASVPFGASASANGVALSWMRAFDIKKQRDLSVFTAFQDFRAVDDALVGVDAITKQAFVSASNHYVRAVKVTVGAGFSVELSNSELADITGITDTDGLTPTP